MESRFFNVTRLYNDCLDGQRTELSQGQGSQKSRALTCHLVLQPQRTSVSTELGQRPCCLGWRVEEETYSLESITLREIFTLFLWALSWRVHRTSPAHLCWDSPSVSHVEWQLLCTLSLPKEESRAGDQVVSQIHPVCQCQQTELLADRVSFRHNLIPSPKRGAWMPCSRMSGSVKQGNFSRGPLDRTSPTLLKGS